MADAFCPHCMRTTPQGVVFCPACGRETSVAAESYQLPIGTVLRGEKGRSYLFGKLKGGGGFGLTYVAKELSSGGVVAIKEYFPNRCQPQRLSDGSVRPTVRMEEIYDAGMQSFLSEASMLRAVSGIPSIVHVLDFFRANGTAYMVMEYLDGVTLGELMQTQSRFEPTLLIDKTLPLMRDIAALHDAGVLHRDIAPDNIMQMPDGSFKLLDFGCARSMEDGKSMTVLLKPGFAPIEQYQTKGQGAFTDIYALCASIYYCLTGKVPPDAPRRLSATFDGLPDPLLPPSALGVGISPDVERVLMWGLALQPTVRPQSMTQLADSLQRAVEPEPTPEPEPVREPTVYVRDAKAGKSFLSRHGGLVFAAVGIIIVIITIIIRFR